MCIVKYESKPPRVGNKSTHTMENKSTSKYIYIEIWGSTFIPRCYYFCR